jgi:SAM-dependent methyltransferase
MATVMQESIGETVRAGYQTIRLQCPGCGEELGHLTSYFAARAGDQSCSNCHFTLRSENGIWQALTSSRVAHFARFIEVYQNIRSAEGRGSRLRGFYLGLPYEDLSGKNGWQWKIRARSYDVLAKKLLPSLLGGGKNSPAVLDLGAGNGWMSYRLALEGYDPVAVDLLTNDEDGLGAAVHFEEQLGFLFPRFRAEMSHLPFAGGQFDAVIFNASFHYAENYHAVMREALRCVKVGGVVIIADSPWYSSDESGERMVAERHAAFAQRHGTASNSIASLEYLTDARLSGMERALGVRWQRNTPYYGLKWTMRPVLARLRGKREPSRFRIYSTRKTV